MPAFHRLPWGDFPDVVLHTTLPTLEAHPAYLSAKSGNSEAAIQLAKDLIIPDKITFPSIDAVVPVVRANAGEKNAIPIAAAALLAQRLNLEPIASITQTNDVGHTKTNAPVPILGQPTFAGKIRPYARVLIVDDVLSYGSSIANLRGWIHQQRAVAFGSTCIASTFGASKLRPPDTIREQLDQRHHDAHRDLAETFGFFGECWTNREARFLLQQSPEILLQLIQAAQAMYGIGYSIRRTQRSQSPVHPELLRVQEHPKEPPTHGR